MKQNIDQHDWLRNDYLNDELPAVPLSSMRDTDMTGRPAASLRELFRSAEEIMHLLALTTDKLGRLVREAQATAERLEGLPKASHRALSEINIAFCTKLIGQLVIEHKKAAQHLRLEMVDAAKTLQKEQASSSTTSTQIAEMLSQNQRLASRCEKILARDIAMQNASLWSLTRAWLIRRLSS